MNSSRRRRTARRWSRCIWIKPPRTNPRHTNTKGRRRRPFSSRSCSASALHIHFQRSNERLLRDVDLAELAHFLFALLLLVEQFAFAGGVAAVALRGHVLAQRAHGFARDDLAADG